MQIKKESKNIAASYIDKTTGQLVETPVYEIIDINFNPMYNHKGELKANFEAGNLVELVA